MSENRWMIDAAADGDAVHLFNTCCDDRLTNCLPVVVINPDNADQVERLAKACPDDWCFEQDAETLADVVQQLRIALRSLVVPPRPTEPTGLGAVVEDAGGETWVRLYEEAPSYIGSWVKAGTNGPALLWDSVAAVRVLSEGVTA